MSTATVPGFYGKVPALGDFVSRRLSRSFIDPWDAWLQSCMASSREQLGDDWLDIYLTSPIWRFVLSTGLCGEQACAGAVMPSVDRVGRYFPLTVAMPIDKQRQVLPMVAKGNDWFDRVEAELLWALEDDTFEIESFEQRVAELQYELPVVEFPKACITAPVDGAPWRVGLDESAQVSARLSDLLCAMLSMGYGSYSIWWTAGSERLSPSLLICTGLPPATGYAALLAGDWHAHGWHDSPAARPHCVVSASEGDAA